MFLRPVFAALLAVLLGCTARQTPDTTRASAPAPAAQTTPAAAPRVLDPRLQLHLFAETPQIVTPIGIAVDRLDHLYVLESHTHLPPKDYPGPKGDIIKRFVDADGDGRPERVSVFAEGFEEGLSLAFSPAGHLYVVTSRAVWRMADHDGDGRSDGREKVLALTEPEKVYAHAALLGITFSADGWMYVSRGNTGSAAWKLVGTDNSTLSGYGDGGNVVRARPDGSGLEAVATGFWNPVDLKFSRQGHLLACDNDPDSRGPNRLVHVVPGGDYGYQSRYGGSGIHPYLAWNGELTGTLPYAAALGEAPSGLLDASQAAFPADYAGQMLCSLWEESRIVRVKLSPRGVSLAGTTQVIVEGGPQFRPVAFAADRKGAVYFTDWVLRKYPNHGQGRLWKLSARPATATLTPRPPYAAPLSDPAGEPLRAVSAAGPYDRLQNALRSGDPFVRHAAVVALARPAYYPQLEQATGHSDPAVRLGAALALQRAGYTPAEPVVGRLLADPAGAVRQRALQWAGQSGLTFLRGQLDAALTAGPVTPALFETYLETVSHLEPAHAEAYRRRSAPYAKSIARPLPSRFIESFVADRSRPAPLRALALRHLPNPGSHQALLFALLAERDPGLRRQTVRTLADLPHEKVAGWLLDL
ncbi:MAG TPA: PVC-type heme-binding CxxCH protein, partial [Cytophagales bacterium]